MLDIVVKCYIFIKHYLSTSFDNIGELMYDDSNNMNMDMKMDMNMDMNMDIETYNAEIKYYNMDSDIESHKMLEIIQPEHIRNFSCGYCSRSIITPSVMYYDNAYCDPICRTKQIKHDTDSSSNPHIRN
jgi:hypothetical protein